MNALAMDTMFTINNDVAYTYIDDETVVMNHLDDQLYGINNVGTVILKQLETQPMSINMLVNYITENFDVNQTQSTDDTKCFLESLLQQQLVKIIAPC
jgi:hypothetical protein